MPTATMLGSSLMSWRTVSRMRSTVSGMCSSLTVGKSDRKIRLHLRSKTAICTRLRANFTPMMWYLAQLRFRPMERRFLSPSMSPVSSMMPCASSFAVILVIAAGVSLMALAICAREQMPLWYRYCRMRERLFSEIDDCWALYLLMLTSLRQCMDSR